MGRRSHSLVEAVLLPLLALALAPSVVRGARVVGGPEADDDSLFRLEGAGEQRVNGKFVMTGMQHGRAEYALRTDKDVVIEWSESRKQWRLYIDNRWGHFRKTLYVSPEDSQVMPLSGWKKVDGESPAPTVTAIVDLELLEGGYVPLRLRDGWVLINASHGCKTNRNVPEVDPLTVPGLRNGLANCMEQCASQQDCVAIDWMHDTGECVLFPAGCTEPTYASNGAMSWVMVPEAIEKKACASWTDHMSFMGEDWISTDDAEATVTAAFRDVFQGACEEGELIEMYYAEKDVGYGVGSGVGTYLKNKVLMHVNSKYKLFHSGVRFLGCGKSLLLQLQARAWGLSGAGEGAFAVGFPYPVTSPDNKHVWRNLNCSVPGRGMRDLGGGNIIYYRTTREPDVVTWARGETKVMSFQQKDIDRFLGEIVPYLSWWNVKSYYLPERLSVQKPTGGGDVAKKVLLRDALVCDTFALWLLAQGLAFAEAEGYSADLFHLGPLQLPKWNKASVTIVDHENGAKNSHSRIGAFDVDAGGVEESDQNFRIGFLRSMHPSAKGFTVAYWETVKGHGTCRQVTDPVEQKQILQRQWLDEETWSSGFPGFKKNSRCVDRVWQGMYWVDMVKYGPWRFFHVGRGADLAALDWNVEAEATYEEPFPIYTAGELQLPGGTPRGPFANGAQPNPCGESCLWEYPVPPPPAEGYRL